jgi:DNA-binding transcriptional ArsR family regulator
VTWDADLARVGSLLGEPARGRILVALADGRALPASVLAAEAHVAPSTASGHLKLLVEAGWLSVEQHGRHRYYRVARDDLGELIEMAVRVAPQPPVRSLKADSERRRMRDARTCYGHLAGRVGVAVLDGLLERGWIEGHDGSFRPGVDELSSTGRDVVYRVTGAGHRGLGALGIDAPTGAGARHCVDWTEQRHHLGGGLGRRIADAAFDRGWVVRAERGRSVTVGPGGARALGAEVA